MCAVESVVPQLRWYGADVRAIGTDLFDVARAGPAEVGSTAEVIRRAEFVFQFESGVFVAYGNAEPHPVLRSEALDTEDPDDVDIGSAIVEVRTFDTTYILLLTDRHDVVTAVLTAAKNYERR